MSKLPSWLRWSHPNAPRARRAWVAFATIIAMLVGFTVAVATSAEAVAPQSTTVPMVTPHHSTTLAASAKCENNGTYTVSYAGSTSNVPENGSGHTATLSVNSVSPSGTSITDAPLTVTGDTTYGFTQTVPGDSTQAQATASLTWGDGFKASAQGTANMDGKCKTPPVTTPPTTPPVTTPPVTTPAPGCNSNHGCGDLKIIATCLDSNGNVSVTVTVTNAVLKGKTDGFNGTVFLNSPNFSDLVRLGDLNNGSGTFGPVTVKEPAGTTSDTLEVQTPVNDDLLGLFANVTFVGICKTPPVTTPPTTPPVTTPPTTPPVTTPPTTPPVTTPPTTPPVTTPPTTPPVTTPPTTPPVTTPPTTPPVTTPPTTPPVTTPPTTPPVTTPPTTPPVTTPPTTPPVTTPPTTPPVTTPPTTPPVTTPPTTPPVTTPPTTPPVTTPPTTPPVTTPPTTPPVTTPPTTPPAPTKPIHHPGWNGRTNPGAQTGANGPTGPTVPASSTSLVAGYLGRRVRLIHAPRHAEPNQV